MTSMQERLGNYEDALSHRRGKNLRIMALSLHIGDVLLNKVAIATMLSVVRPGARVFYRHVPRCHSTG